MRTHPRITKEISDTIHQIRNWNTDERRLMSCNTLAGIREYVRIALDEVRDSIKPKSAPVETAETLRGSLWCASRAAYMQGATDAQIDLLVKLHSERGDFRSYTGRLTKGEASAIISNMKG